MEEGGRERESLLIPNCCALQRTRIRQGVAPPSPPIEEVANRSILPLSAAVLPSIKTVCNAPPFNREPAIRP